MKKKKKTCLYTLFSIAGNLKSQELGNETRVASEIVLPTNLLFIQEKLRRRPRIQIFVQLTTRQRMLHCRELKRHSTSSQLTPTGIAYKNHTCHNHNYVISAKFACVRSLDQQQQIKRFGLPCKRVRRRCKRTANESPAEPTSCDRPSN